MSTDALRDLAHQAEYFQFTWGHLYMSLVIIAVVFLINEWKMRP